MFFDDVVSKLKADRATAPFVVTLPGSAGAEISGVKRVIFFSSDEVRLAAGKSVLCVRGEGLDIAEMGGGDVLVRGKVKGVDID